MSRGISQSKYEEVCRELQEAKETLRAIRSGEVDAIIVAGPQGDNIYSLSGADLPYRQLIEQMSEGVATLSASGMILYCNNSFARMVKIPLDRAIGATMEQFIHPSHRETFAASVRAAMKNNLTDEFTLCTAENTRMHALISFTAVAHAEGSISIIVTDLTERRKAEEGLREAYGQLEERTEKLEAANKELEGFSYTISHDLRAPLRAINCYLAIIKEDYNDLLPEAALKNFAVARENAKEMGAMIDKFLEFTRLGRAGLHATQFDMEQLVRQVIGDFLKPGDGDLRIDIETLAPACGDRNLILHVMANLLSNAVKFSRSNPHPHIIIGSKTTGEGTIYSVHDNGVGFKMDYVDKLFGVFQRLHGKHEFEGMGVGLAICRRIIELHGGKIWAEGEVDKGATFYFSLPAERK